MSSSRATTSVRPWDQSPEFLEATDHVVHPGGRPYYGKWCIKVVNRLQQWSDIEAAQARPIGNDLNDFTEFIAGQAEWTDQNMPSIMYMLFPPAGWHELRLSRPAPPKKDVDGKLVLEKYPLPGKRVKPLRDYKILPDKIGTNNPWWYYEAIRRIDPRVAWNDILMRMPRQGRRNQDALNMECSRMRPRYHMISWHPASDESKANELQNQVVKLLSDEQQAANTTRGSTPGLIDPRLGEAGGRIQIPRLVNGQGTVRGSRPQKPRAKKQKVTQTEVPVESNEGAVGGIVEEALGTGLSRQSHYHPSYTSTTNSPALPYAGFPYNRNLTSSVNTSEDLDPGKRKRAAENAYLYNNQGITFGDQPTTGEEEVRRKRKRVAYGSSAYLEAGCGVQNGGSFGNPVNSVAESGTVQPTRGEPGPSNTASRNLTSPQPQSTYNSRVLPPSLLSSTQALGQGASDEATRNGQSTLRNPNWARRAHPDILSPDELEAMLEQIGRAGQHDIHEDQNMSNRPVRQPQNLKNRMTNVSGLRADNKVPCMGECSSSRLSGERLLPQSREHHGPATPQYSATHNHGVDSESLGFAGSRQVSPSCEHEQPVSRKRRASNDNQVPHRSSQMAGNGSHLPDLELKPVTKRRRAANGNTIPTQPSHVGSDRAFSPRLEEGRTTPQHRQSESGIGAAGQSLQVGSGNPLQPSREHGQSAFVYSTGGPRTLLSCTENPPLPPSFGVDRQSVSPVQDYLAGEPARASDPGFDFDTAQDEHFARYSSPPLIASRPSSSSVPSRSGTRIGDLGNVYTNTPNPTATASPNVGLPSTRSAENTSSLSLPRLPRRNNSSQAPKPITDEEFDDWIQMHEL